MCKGPRAPNAAINGLQLRSCIFQMQKKEELKRLAGPGLLLLERHLDGEETHDATAYYVIAGPDGILDLVEGGKVAAGQAVCGRVRFYLFPG